MPRFPIPNSRREQLRRAEHERAPSAVFIVLVSRQMNYAGERLLPATRTYSYRQKVQRAFAAEFLSPFASVDEMLSGDYSEDTQNDIAEHFNVSPMTIRTQLVNRDRIDLEDAPDIAGRGAD